MRADSKYSGMDDIQQIADAVYVKGLKSIVRTSVQQDSTRLRRLLTELFSDSFHAVLALSPGPAKYQCCITTLKVVVYRLVARVLQANMILLARNHGPAEW